MPIDVEAKGSPGWWFRYLSNQMFRKPKLEMRAPGIVTPELQQMSRFDRLTILRERHEGNPPLPEGAESAREVFRAFQRKTRTNFHELIDEAPRERMNLTGFRTAAAGDEVGDDEARKLWNANQMPVEFGETLDYMLSMGDGYTMVGPPPEGSAYASITAEDPRQCITAHDPIRQQMERAGLKLFHDEEEGTDRAFVYLPKGAPDGNGGRLPRARMWEGVRESRNGAITRSFSVSPKAWDWVVDGGEPLPMNRVPLTRFRNRRGMAEFEPHIDIIDRMNHTMLQRMVILTLQAFKQRAVKGVPTLYPKGHAKAGQEIDYSDVFVTEPDALWILPMGAEMWESGALDITPITGSIADDAKYLMAVSRTPFYAINPDAANGSAEGASLQREGLVYKTENRITRASVGAVATISKAFEVQDDRVRMELGALEPIWAPVERFSLAEKYDAATKAKSAGVPELTIWSDILGFTPDQIKRMQGERLQERLLQPLAPAAPGQPAAPLQIPPAERVDQPPAA